MAGSGWGEAGAAREIILRRLGAGEACGLAILEAIVCHGVVALGACRADAKIRLHAGSELVMIGAGHAQGLLAACILLLADVLGIGKCGLIISTACAGGGQRVARGGSTCREASAGCKCVLRRLGAH